MSPARIHKAITAAFLGCLFLGFTPTAGILTAALLILQWAVGAALARMLMGRPLPVLETMSFGGILGLSAVVVARQLVVNLPSPRVLTVVVLATILVVAGVWQQRFRPHALLTRDDQQFLVPVAGLSLLQVAPGLTWPSLAGLTCMAFASQSMQGTRALCLSFRRALLALGYVATAVVLAVAIFGLDSIWSGSRDQDSQFFEALGILVSRFGVDAGSPVLAGQSVAKYHWLASGWIGTVNDISGASPYLFQTQIAPFMNGVILFSSIIGIARRLGVSHGLLVLIAGGMLGMGGTDLIFYSQSLSLSAIAALLHFGVTSLDAIHKTTSRFPLVVGMSLLGTVTFFSKASAIAIALSVLLASALIHYRRNQRFSEALLWAAALTVTIGIFLATYLGSEWGSANQPRRIEELSGGGIGGLNESLWQLRTEIGALLHPLALFGAVVGLLVWSRRKSVVLTHEIDEIRTFVAVASGIASILTVGSWLTDDSAVSGTLLAHLSFATCLCTVLILASLVCMRREEPRLGHAGDKLRIGGWIALLAVVFSFLGLMIGSSQSIKSKLWGTAFGRDGIGRWFVWLIVDQSAFFVCLLTALTVLVVARVWPSVTSYESPLRTDTPARSLLSALVVFTTCTSVANWYDKADHVRGLNTRLFHNTEGEDINLPATRSRPIRALGEFVRRELPKEAIVASNNFCCSGETWIDEPTTANWRAAFGGANFQIGAETQRRVLAQGLLFGSVAYRSTPVLNEEEERRLRLSLSFANSPSLSDVTALRDYGVTHFIVNLHLTSHTDWREFGPVVYRDNQFLIIALR